MSEIPLLTDTLLRSGWRRVYEPPQFYFGLDFSAAYEESIQVHRDTVRRNHEIQREDDKELRETLIKELGRDEVKDMERGR